MATIYITRSGDMVDDLCWRHYGSERETPLVLAANPGLAAYGPHLPAGVNIILPDPQPAAENEIVSLWE